VSGGRDSWLFGARRPSLASRSPYAERFFGSAASGSPQLLWPSLLLKSTALPCPPSGANISTCKVHLVLRTAVLHSLLRRLQRFSTIRHPIAVVACCKASWQSPRLDLHRLAAGIFHDPSAERQLAVWEIPRSLRMSMQVVESSWHENWHLSAKKVEGTYCNLPRPYLESSTLVHDRIFCL